MDEKDMPGAVDFTCDCMVKCKKAFSVGNENG